VSGASWKIDIDAVRAAAAGRWVEILTALAGLTPDQLSGRHQPCPRPGCGGTDRFRAFDDVNETGGVFCNSCHDSRNGDGFSTLQWQLAIDFIEAVKRVNAYLGYPGGGNPAQAGASGRNEARDPAANLEFLPWNRLQAALWCRHKPPVTVEGLESCHARIARYRGQWPVMALPIFGRPEVGDASIVGWAMFALNGGTLPVYRKGQEPEWKKVKLTAGSGPGWLGQVDRIASGDVTQVWKPEGLSDLLTLASQALPPDHAVITNAFGAKEDPAKLPTPLLESLAGLHANIIHDCDTPGQEGATFVPRDQGKPPRPGWAPAIAAHAATCRNVVLPYPIVPDHGPDLRDWFVAGGTFEKLTDLADDAETIAAAAESPDIREADNDPHRLARVNLVKMRARGRDIKFWRDEWYIWKGSKYRKITAPEFRAKLGQSIKEEFDECHVRDMERWRKKSAESEKQEPPPVALKVGKSLVTNVMDATAGMVVISSSVEPMTWLPDRSRRNYLSMANGLLDIDELLADGDDYLLPHSPDWFSTVSLPYSFVPEAECPKWTGFLEYNLEGDKDRIATLQQWAGYLLTADSGQQKFLLLEGEGSNGKSVYLAGVTAMLGDDNVSNVSLEIFGDRFSRTDTIGKLANIAGDCEEMDRVAEGYIKSFTSGDRMYFDRKGLSGINCVPTARMMVSCNERPKFRDRSKGIWRRMLLVPWQRQIHDEMKVANMDKPIWWQNSGELPGMLWWALKGLQDLRERGRFTDSTISRKAKDEYQIEMNSARAFLTEFTAPSSYMPGERFIRCEWLYRLYCEWAKDGNNKPFGRTLFGKEMHRVYPDLKRRQRREKMKDGKAPQHWVYDDIVFTNDAICGINTDDRTDASEATI
jgi:P4 family phage/plasmid primase-like protien